MNKLFVRTLCAVLILIVLLSVILTSCTIIREDETTTASNNSNGSTSATAVTTVKTEKPKLTADKMEDGQMLVEFLKIGKADCIIINENGHTVMIDAGESDDRSDIFSRIILDKIDKIDYLIITHFHNDHIGSAAEVIKTYDIGTIIEPTMTPENQESEVYIAYKEALKNTSATVISTDDEYTFTLGDMSFRVYGSGKTYDKDNDNNSSLVTELTHAGHSFLFAADAEKDRITDLIADGIGKFDFLKVPHHGTYNKMSYKFIDTVSPKYAVVTCSDKNEADFIVLEYMKNKGIEAYQTLDGNIFLVSDSGGITIYQ